MVIYYFYFKCYFYLKNKKNDIKISKIIFLLFCYILYIKPRIFNTIYNNYKI